MKTFVVGGAVRDRLLGLPVIDRDHVVVGATVDEMLAAGFRPVGRDFPVFLHPETHEEYALARTERKVAPGYAGFVFHANPTVTLEADLERRDLTINAIAEDEATGSLIDPFDGRRDLALRLFRHVGPAFVEDPVRVLRIARFAARFTDFVVEADTLALMRSMARAGEIDALVPERVWQEIARGLMESRPSRMIEVLLDADALRPVLPEVEALFAVPRREAGERTLRALDRAAARNANLDIRFAVLVHAIDGMRNDGPGARPSLDLETLCKRLGVPKTTRELALLVVRERSVLLVDATEAGSIDALVEAMERSDAFRRPTRFRDAIEAIACTIDEPIEAEHSTSRLMRAFDAAAAVDAGAIARTAGYDPALIATRVRQGRVVAVRQSFGDDGHGSPHV